MSEYYIICKRHGYRQDFAVNFWGPNRSGYSYNLNHAGVYSEEEAKSFPSSHYCDDMPVLKSVVDNLSELYVVDNSELGQICKNTTKNRKLFGIKLTELHPGPTNWDSRAFVKPDRFLHLNKNTLDIIEQIKTVNNEVLNGK